MKILILILLSFQLVFSLNNGLGLTPQMGWNSWNKFNCNINDQVIRTTAQQIVNLGLKDLGYNYVNVDDCWMLKDRDAEGHMQVDTEAFPNGLKSVIDYVHSLGLKFGLYSSAGTLTCQQRAGSLNYEKIDAQDWASWGVDYLKYDNCYNTGVPALQRYTAMRDALNATGRQIFYSICNWGEEKTALWAPEVGNSWRTTGDIQNNWISVVSNFRLSQLDASRAGPGGWNDPDMLEIGNNGLTIQAERTHMALWAIVKAPLIIGCDLSSVTDESLAILKNKDLIAISQDPHGQQAFCIQNCGAWSYFNKTPIVYASLMQNGDIAVVVANLGYYDSTAGSFLLTDLGKLYNPTIQYKIYNIWTQETSDITGGQVPYSTIKAQDNIAYRLVVQNGKTW